ncbi:MAG: hypothetical protein D6706_01545 [Chloroflexi bacterium]|nr:MAG: hypothetical protein D6706_01545 [Chloroflexota bacterium]
MLPASFPSQFRSPTVLQLILLITLAARVVPFYHKSSASPRKVGTSTRDLDASALDFNVPMVPAEVGIQGDGKPQLPATPDDPYKLLLDYLRMIALRLREGVTGHPS